mgnify:CR=1 FL=1
MIIILKRNPLYGKNDDIFLRRTTYNQQEKDRSKVCLPETPSNITSPPFFFSLSFSSRARGPKRNNLVQANRIVHKTTNVSTSSVFPPPPKANKASTRSTHTKKRPRKSLKRTQAQPPKSPQTMNKPTTTPQRATSPAQKIEIASPARGFTNVQTPAVCRSAPNVRRAAITIMSVRLVGVSVSWAIVSNAKHHLVPPRVRSTCNATTAVMDMSANNKLASKNKNPKSAQTSALPPPNVRLVGVDLHVTNSDVPPPQNEYVQNHV